MAAGVGAALMLIVLIPVLNVCPTCFNTEFVILSTQCIHLL